MKQGRETTQEERIAIVKDCLENGSNYGENAIKYNISYQQIYTWMKKFKELGEVGLDEDNARLRRNHAQNWKSLGLRWHS